MASKALMVLGFLLAALLLISSEVAARQLAENDEEVPTKESANDAKYGDGGGYPGRGNPGRGNPYPGPGNRCRHGCCGHDFRGGCRCCSYEGEVAEFQAEAKPDHN